MTRCTSARRRRALRGLTVLGGEPFGQPEGLAALLRGAH
jgi:hypothetical protein